MLRPFLYSFVFFSSVCWSHRPTRSVLGGEDRINKYDITYPKVIKQSQDEVQWPGHPDELTVELTVEGKKFTLELELNKVVFSKNFKHTVRGGSSYKEYTNMENCYYQGKVREEPEWSVVISTCKGLRGAFGVLTVRNNSYYIEPMEGKVNGAHIVYRPSELSDSHFRGKCGSETGDSSELHNIPSFPVQKKDFNNSKVKRQAGTDLYLELYVVTDVAAYTTRGRDMESLLQDVTEAVNVMDNFYRKLNTVVRIALVEIETWTTNNLISVTSDARATLNLWKMHYQGNINTKPSRPDAGLLFVGGTFQDSILGIAPTEAMCRSTNGGVSRLRVRNPLATATTAAHELGHMYGLRHDDDTDPCPCSAGQCIMSAIISTIPQVWSECSQTAFTKFVTDNNYAELCLDDEPVFINSQNNIPYQCGNGIMEPGETCDCGPVETCTDPCCNATTCELAETASCSTHEACCQNCKFREAGIRCRDVANECDVPEFCTGQAGQCPTNRFLRNGYNCTNGNELGYCIDGQCLTHSTQCKSIYGSGSSTAPARCYDYNTEGNCYGKCGRVGVSSSFIGCSEEDVLCGMTWCVPTSLSPRSVPSGSLSATIRCSDGITRAKSVCYDGTNAEVSDPGYVWDNIRCGTNKVCMNQRCVTANFATNTCPIGINGTECNGNGVCTNENNCFCDSGFTGPACDNRAVIGSPSPGTSSPGGSNAGGIAAGVIIALLLVAGIGVAVTVVLVYIFVIRPRRASKVVTSTRNKTHAHYVNPDRHTAYSPSPPANLTKNPSYNTPPQRRPPPTKPATNGYSPRVAHGHVNSAGNPQPMQPPVRNRDPPPPPYNPSSKPTTSAVQPRRPPPPPMAPMKQGPMNPPVSSKPPVAAAKPTPPSKPATAVKPPVGSKPGKVSAVWPPPSNNGTTAPVNKQPLLPPNIR